MYVETFPDYKKYDGFYNRKDISVDSQGRRYLGDPEGLDEQIDAKSLRIQKFQSCLGKGIDFSSGNYTIDDKICYYDLNNKKDLNNLIIGRSVSSFTYFTALFLRKIALNNGYDFLLDLCVDNLTKTIEHNSKEKEKKLLNTDIISFTLYLFDCSINYFHKIYVKEAGQKLFKICKMVLENIDNFSGKCIKKDFLDNLTKITKKYYSKLQIIYKNQLNEENLIDFKYEEVESLLIKCNISFIKSESLDKRLTALKFIDEVLKNSEKTNIISEDIYMYLIDEIFGTNSHPQLVLKSKDILEHLLKSNMIPPNKLITIFEFIEKADNESRKMLIKLFQEHLYVLESDSILKLLNKVYSSRLLLKDINSSDDLNLIFEMNLKASNKDSSINLLIFLVNCCLQEECCDSLNKITNICNTISQICFDNEDCLYFILKLSKVALNPKLLPDLVEEIKYFDMILDNKNLKPTVFIKILNSLLNNVQSKGNSNSFEILTLNIDFIEHFFQNWSEYNKKYIPLSSNKNIIIEGVNHSVNTSERISFFYFLALNKYVNIDQILNLNEYANDTFNVKDKKFHALLFLFEILNNTPENKSALFVLLESLLNNRNFSNINKNIYLIFDNLFKDTKYLENISIEEFNLFTKIFFSINSNNIDQENQGLNAANPIEQESYYSTEAMSAAAMANGHIPMDLFEGISFTPKNEVQKECFRSKINPDKLEGIQIIWNIIMVCETEKLVSMASSIINNLYSNQNILVQENEEYSLLDTENKVRLHDLLLKKCMSLITINSSNKMIVKSLGILKLIIEESNDGNDQIKPHSSILRKNLIELNIHNRINDKSKKFTLSVYDNTTIYEIKKLIEKRIGYHSDFILLSVYRTNIKKTIDLQISDNNKSVGNLDINYGDIVYCNLNERIARNIKRVSLTEGMKPKKQFIKILEDWFDYFKNKDSVMDRQSIGTFITSVTGSNNTIPLDDYRINNFLREYDIGNKGNLSKDEFIRFYTSIVNNHDKLSNIWDNLNNMGVRNDLKYFSDPIDNEKITNVKVSVRSTLTKSQEFFKIIFELLDKEEAIAREAYSFLSVIGTNLELHKKLILIYDNEKASWEELINSKSIFRSLYILEIIQSLIQNKDLNAESEKEMNSIFDIFIDCNLSQEEISKKLQDWKMNFIKYNGLEYLLEMINNLINLENFSIDISSSIVSLVEVCSNIINNLFEYMMFEISDEQATFKKHIQSESIKSLTLKMSKLVKSCYDSNSLINSKKLCLNTFETLLFLIICSENENTSEMLIENKVFIFIFECLFSNNKSNKHLSEEALKNSFLLVEKLSQFNSVLKSKICNVLMTSLIYMFENILFADLNKPIINYNEEYLCEKKYLDELILLSTNGNSDVNLDGFLSLLNTSLKVYLGLENKIDINNIFPTLDILRLSEILLLSLYIEENIEINNFNQINSSNASKISNLEITNDSEDKNIDFGFKNKNFNDELSKSIQVNKLNILSCILTNYHKSSEVKLFLNSKYFLIENILGNILFKTYSTNNIQDMLKDQEFVPKVFATSKYCGSNLDTSLSKALYNLLSSFLENNLENILSIFSSDILEKFSVKEETQYYYRMNDGRREGYSGIKNLGCICYMISMLQQFFMSPTFRYKLLECNDNEVRTNGEYDDNVLHQIQRMFSFLDLSEREDYDPKGFCYSFKDWDGKPVDVRIQQDSQEFLNRFLDIIEEKIKPTPHKYLMSDVFGGKTCSQLSCSECGNITRKFEIFLNLNLEIKGLSSLNASLDHLIIPENVDNYFCEKCQKKVTISKRNLIASLPNVLIVYLNRIRFNYEIERHEKINSLLEFPKDINLKNYTIEEQFRKLNIEETDQIYMKDNSYYDYNLVGVNVHIGSADAGHYFSYINSQRDGEEDTRIFTNSANSEGFWLKFNDSNVSKFKIENLESECFGGNRGGNSYYSRYENCQSAYMLIYERKQKVPSKIILNENFASECIKEINDMDNNLNNIGLEKIKQLEVHQNTSKYDNFVSFNEEEKDIVNKYTDVFKQSPDPEYYNKICKIIKSTIFYDTSKKEYYSFEDFYKPNKKKVIPKVYFLDIMEDNSKFRKLKTSNDENFISFYKGLNTSLENSLKNADANNFEEAKRMCFGLISYFINLENDKKNIFGIISEKIEYLINKFQDSDLSEQIVCHLFNFVKNDPSSTKTKFKMSNLLLNTELSIVSSICKIYSKLFTTLYSKAKGKIRSAHELEKYNNTPESLFTKLFDYLISLFPNIPRYCYSSLHPIYDVFEVVYNLGDEVQDYICLKKFVTLMVLHLCGNDHPMFRNYSNDSHMMSSSFYPDKPQKVIDIISKLFEKSTHFNDKNELQENLIVLSEECIKAVTHFSFMKYLSKYDSSLFKKYFTISMINKDCYDQCKEVLESLDNCGIGDNNQFISITKFILELLNIKDNNQKIRIENLIGFPQYIIRDPTNRIKFPTFGYSKVGNSSQSIIDYPSSILKYRKTFLEKFLMGLSNERLVFEVMYMIFEACLENDELLRHMRHVFRVEGGEYGPEK